MTWKNTSWGGTREDLHPKVIGQFVQGPRGTGKAHPHTRVGVTSPNFPQTWGNLKMYVTSDQVWLFLTVLIPAGGNRGRKGS